jgi:release factor glutamine methyltransferase
LIVLPGVFRPCGDTRLLARALDVVDLAPGARVLDVCTGSGALALAAAAHGWDVTAIDVSRRAVLNARLNARRRGLRVRVLCGDLFAPVAGERFELVVANPPYVPVPPRGATGPRSRAWDAGADGRLLLDRICDDLGAHLTPDGGGLLVQSSVADVGATVQRLEGRGLRAAPVASRAGPLGPIVAARAGYLRSRGTLTGDQEEIVVLRAFTASAELAQAA